MRGHKRTITDVTTANAKAFPLLHLRTLPEMLLHTIPHDTIIPYGSVSFTLMENGPMGRKSKVWYRTDEGAFMTTIKGKQVVLAKGPDDSPDGPVRAAAGEKFRELMEMADMGLTRETTWIRTVCAAFIKKFSPVWKPRTLDLRQRYCRLFTDAIGGKTIGWLTPNIVTEVIDRFRGTHYRENRLGRRAYTFGDGAAAHALTTIKAVTAWAAESGIVKADPLRALAHPVQLSSGREALISDEEHSAVLAALCKPKDQYLRRFIIALACTGARPGEICAAEARYWRKNVNAIVYPAKQRARRGEHSHKTAHRGDDRIIRFEGEALPIIEDLMSRYPIGPLFRTSKGKRWNVVTLCTQFQRKVQAVLGRTTVTPKSYRHRFATKWLESGGDIDTLSKLIGASPRVIIHHYGHPNNYSPVFNAHLAAFLADQ